jgi:hypothetical protein
MKNISKLILIALPIIFIIIIIFPNLFLSFYSEFQADDYSILLTEKKYGYFGSIINYYTNWSGRYFAYSHCLIYIGLLGDSIRSYYWIFPLMIQLLFIVSLWFLIKTLFLKFSLSNRLFIYAIFIASYFWQFPSFSEAYVWLSASYSYQLGLNLTIIFLSILFRKKDNYNKIEKLQLFFLTFAIIGCSEINILFLNFIIVCYILYIYINDKTVNRLLSFLLIFSFLCSLLSILAPGNKVRGEFLIESAKSINAEYNENLYFSFKNAFITIKKEILTFLLKTPLLLFSALFIIVLSSSKIKFEIKTNLRNILLFAFIILSFYFFLHIPSIYKQGVFGVPVPKRILNSTNFIFLIGWFSTIFLLYNYLNNLNIFSLTPKLSYFLAILITSYCLIQLLNPNEIQDSWRDLLSGKAKIYKNDLRNRALFFEKNKKKEINVPPLHSIPYSIYYEDVRGNASYWVNQVNALYYEVDSIRVDSSILAPVVVIK